MMPALVGKLLRDVRLPLIAVCLLLGGFQCLWAKITQRVTEEILPSITQHLPLEFILDLLFKGPGQIIQTLIGGEKINFAHALDVLSISYVHPLTQAILCIWAIGRAAGAIAGEIDRGTMELLLAQPLARWRLVLAHLLVDGLTILVLCLSMWAGNWLGAVSFGHIEWGASPKATELRVDPRVFVPGLVSVATLLFAVSGYTLTLSSRGRFRMKVLGLAVLITLLQFLINLIAQLWDTIAFLRPFTVFYYFQPQQVILGGGWSVNLAHDWSLAHPLEVNGVAVLALVGVLGYVLAAWTFCRRDLPAPL
jgi:ABC-2 type transport system permease protein